MRAGRDYSESFQTETELSIENITDARVVDEVPRLSQTSATRLDGRKGEKALPQSIVSNGVTEALQRAKTSWLETSDVTLLRSALLRLLLVLDEDA